MRPWKILVIALLTIAGIGVILDTRRGERTRRLRDQLPIDATLGGLSQAPVDRAIGSGDGDAPEERVERDVRAVTRVTREVERLGRALIRFTVEAPALPRRRPRRGYCRIEWLESALAPWRDWLDGARWRRLVCAPAMISGFEAVIVPRDVCGLRAREASSCRCGLSKPSCARC